MSNRLVSVLVLLMGLAPLAAYQGGVAASMSRSTHPSGESLSAHSGDGLLQFTSGGHVLGFRPGQAILAGLDHALTVGFPGGSGAMPTGRSAAGAQDNGAPQLSEAIYAGVWPGVDIHYTPSAGGVVESTYILQPGARVQDIRLRYNAPVEPMRDGGLKFGFQGGFMTESAPVAWQEIAGERVPVAVHFVVFASSEVGFALGAYSPEHALVIDPAYAWHTFYGNAVTPDFGRGLVVDAAGNIYIVGDSPGPWNGPGPTAPLHAFPGTANDNIVVVKLSSSGAYQWHTFYGSSSAGDVGYGIALGGTGNILVTGYSSATWNGPGFPAAALPKNAFAGGSGQTNIVVLKLTGNGSYQWHTFYGSSASSDLGEAVAMNGSGIYVAGQSYLTWNGPGPTAPLNAFAGASHYDIMVLKLSNSGGYLWHTFYGGSSGNDEGNDLALDGSGNVYVVGHSAFTWAGPGPTVPLNAHAGGLDITVLKLAGNGTYQWHTFYGSSAAEYGQGIALDSSANVYVAGYSLGSWLGPGGPVYPQPLHAYAGSGDLTVVKLDTNGDYQWHTFYGSAGAIDSGKDVAVDGAGDIYVTGHSIGTWDGPGPTAPLNAFAGAIEAVLLKLNGSGAYQWHTFYGSAVDSEYGYGVALDPNGHVDVTGYSGDTWNGPGAKPPLNYAWGAGDIMVVETAVTTTQNYRSQAASDGRLLESSENSSAGGWLNSTDTTFRLGDDASDRQFRSILHFNTAGLPDTAVVTSLTLKIKRNGAFVGNADPFTTHGNIRADIKNGSFSGNPALELGDWQASAAASNVGSFPNSPVSDWYTAVLTFTAYSKVNLTGETQFRLRFSTGDDDDLLADYWNFFSGDYGTTSARPLLMVQYYVP